MKHKSKQSSILASYYSNPDNLSEFGFRDSAINLARAAKQKSREAGQYVVNRAKNDTEIVKKAAKRYVGEAAGEWAKRNPRQATNIAMGAAQEYVAEQATKGVRSARNNPRKALGIGLASTAALGGAGYLGYQAMQDEDENDLY